MPVDDTLPPCRLPAVPDLDLILRHFPAAFGIRVDAEGLDGLPAPERQRYATARMLEPPEAVLLDRVLQLAPLRFLRGIDRIVILPTRGTGRPGGYLNGIVSVSAAEADSRHPDPEWRSRFSVFTTTVAHEIGHATYETVLTAEERDRVLGSYVRSPKAVAGGVLSELDVQHHLIEFFMSALLGYGRLPYGGASSRRALAAFGLDLSQP